MGCLKSKEQTADLNLDSGDSYAPLLDENSSVRQVDDFDDTVGPRRNCKSNSKNPDYGLESLLLGLRNSLSWRNIYVDRPDKASLAELRTKIHGLLNTATVEMGFLLQDRRYSEAEDVVNAILKLKGSLGNELFDALQITAFVREVTSFKGFVLTGGQYFEPMMVNENDDNVLKVYFFLISENESRRTMFRYYVEYTSLIEEFFSLKLVSSSEHVRVEMYGSSCPSYWEIRRDVIRNVRENLELDEDERD